MGPAFSFSEEFQMEFGYGIHSNRTATPFDETSWFPCVPLHSLGEVSPPISICLERRPVGQELGKGNPKGRDKGEQ